MTNKNKFLVKFTVVAAMIGLFSPSVNLQTGVQSNSSGFSILPAHISVSLFHAAEARRGGGGGGARRGGGARSRPARSGNRNVNTNRNSNRNTNRNVNRNVNHNRNVNVNVNNRYYGGHGRGYGYYGGRPILAFSTGLIIGSVIASASMPTTCTTVIANGISYRRCDSSYYQPFYEGDTFTLLIVKKGILPKI